MPTLSWLRSLGRDVGEGLLHLIYPGLCHLCDTALGSVNESFCSDCRAGLLNDPYPACPRCAGTIGPFTNTDGGCPHCRDESFAFASVIRFGPYQGIWRDAVLRLKHHAGEGLAELLGAVWAEHARSRFASLKADFIIPVPLHWWRRWSRGYNQSTALAHGLAKSLHLPYQPSWLRRIRNTPAQHLLLPSARRENLKKAFRICRAARVQGRTILLVDDVMTTGATAHAAAAALRKAGALQVHVAAFARASS